ncbi:hypothetical protein HQ590_06410 [bacterium]|nr:hypothetical protein [bacterium]
MIFTSRKLERALAEGRIAGWEAARYYFVPTIIAAVMAMPCWLLRPRYSIHPKPVVILVQFLLQVLAGVLVYHGVKKCFRTNHQIDSRDFISRIVILGFPVFIKVIGLALVASLALVHVGMRFLPRVHPQILGATLWPLMIFVTFALINESLKRFGAEKEKSQPSPGAYSGEAANDLTGNAQE